MEDNPTLSKKVKKRYERMFSGVWYQRYILGMWSVAEGIIYDMFDEVKHTFKREQLGIKRFSEYYVSIDYGTSSVMCFLLYGVRKGKVYLLKEFYYDAKQSKKQKTDAEFVEDFKEFVGDKTIRLIYVDPSASSFKTALNKEGYNQVRDADNDVVNGIRTVGTFLGTDRLFIDENCENVLREFHEYVWDEKNRDKGIDKPVKQNDHAMDSLRYFIHTKYGDERGKNLRERYRTLTR